jgi:pyrrolidone-carboxylate peptidase
LPSNISHNGRNILLIVPNGPIPAAYHDILSQTPSLIQQHDPDLVIHMGLADKQEYFSIERSANKEGYHEIPDVKRKVLTRAENKKTFGKSALSLASSLDLDTAFSALTSSLLGVHLPIEGAIAKGKGKQKGKPLDVRLTDAVGNFVCGCIYYVSLLEMEKRGKKKNVVFLHTTLLESEEELKVGVRVVEGVIRALVDVWEG